MTEERLIKLLKEFRNIEPSQEALHKGLDLLLQKVDQKFNQDIVNEKVTTAVSGDIFTFKDRAQVLGRQFVAPWSLLRNFAVSSVRLYSSHVVASVLITAVVFGAVGAYSGISARHALPDDKPIYTLKRALEKTQLTLSFSTAKRAEVRVNLLARRLEELDRLVAKTITNPEHNGTAVAMAIKNSQNEAAAVKADLAAMINEEPLNPEIKNLKQLLADRVLKYRIALNETQVALPDNIKNELEPEVAALDSTISDIDEAIEQLDKNLAAQQNQSTDQPGLATSTGEVFGIATGSVVDLIGGVNSTTVSTTDMLLINQTGKTASTSADQGAGPALNMQSPKNQTTEEQEPFSLEEDAFKIHIGN